MTRPVGSAIRPRMPASWLSWLALPRAPDRTIIASGLCASRPSRTAAATRSRASVQMATAWRERSASVSRPRPMLAIDGRHPRVGLGQDARLRGRDRRVGRRQRQAAARRVLEAQPLHGLGHLDQQRRAALVDRRLQQGRQPPLVERAVGQPRPPAQARRQRRVEQAPPDRRLDAPHGQRPVGVVRDRRPHRDARPERDVAEPVGQLHLVGVGEGLALAARAVLRQRQVVAAQHRVLARRERWAGRSPATARCAPTRGARRPRPGPPRTAAGGRPSGRRRSRR